jgi:hypothetical protein
MAEALAPIDESVKIPEAVKAAAAKAESFYTPTEPEKTQEPSETQAQEPAVAQAPEPVQAPPPVEPPPSNETEQLRAELAKRERDYNALLGRNAQQRDYIAMQQNQLSQMSNPRSWAQPQQAKPLISDEERKAYGDDALSVMERKAREVVQPVVDQMQARTIQLERQIQQVRSNDVFSELDRKMPDWETINDSNVWKEWLALPDVYSNMVRQQLLEAAFSAGDAGRILAFFRGFQAEHPEHAGQETQAPQSAPPQRAPVRKAAVSLESLAAPGRASSSPPPALTSEAPTISSKDVTQFYRDVTQGRYNGREEAKAAREAQIHAAVRDGRVRFK